MSRPKLRHRRNLITPSALHHGEECLGKAERGSLRRAESGTATEDRTHEASVDRRRGRRRARNFSTGLGAEQHRNPASRSLLDVGYDLGSGAQAPACSRPYPCDARRHWRAPSRRAIGRECHGEPAQPARTFATPVGWLHTAARSRICARVRNSVTGATSLQRAVITLEPATRLMLTAMAYSKRATTHRPIVQLRTDREDRSMKHLLTGVAVFAALAISAPVWAQQSPGGNSMGTPGPNPGGPGLTPYTSPQRPMAAPAPSAPPAAMAPSAAPPSSMSDTSSAMPPRHRAARHTSHGRMAGHHRGKGPQLSGDSANQLNQEELARLQAGNMSNPSAPPPPGMMAPAPGRGGPPMTTHGTVQ
jgi:hypothetical protein